MAQRALVTGSTGQDGSYLAELLLAEGYEVHGLARGATDGTDARGVHQHRGDVADGPGLRRLVEAVAPHEVYNLAAQSHVAASFEARERTAETNATGAELLLAAIRATGTDCRFFQASSAELFASSPPPQDERAPFSPRSPYGEAKLRAHRATVAHREEHGAFAVAGLLFNHESPRRGEGFVTRTVSVGVAEIALGRRETLPLGDLDAVRDWGYAPEYVEAMWRMLRHDAPVDLVLATGRGHTVRDFVAAAFAHAGLDWEDHVTFDPRFARPAEPHPLVGDPRRAEAVLGWRAATHAEALARLMVDADLARLGSAGSAGRGDH